MLNTTNVFELIIGSRRCFHSITRGVYKVPSLFLNCRTIQNRQNYLLCNHLRDWKMISFWPKWLLGIKLILEGNLLSIKWPNFEGIDKRLRIPHTIGRYGQSTSKWRPVQVYHITSRLTLTGCHLRVYDSYKVQHLLSCIFNRLSLKKEFTWKVLDLILGSAQIFYSKHNLNDTFS